MPTTLRSLRLFFLGLVLLTVLTPARAQWWHWHPAGADTLPRVTSAQNGGSGLTPSLNNYTPGSSPNQPLANDYTTGASLFNFGTVAGDTLFVKNDDASQHLSWAGAGPEGTSLSMPFFNSRFQHTYVGNNGILSFNSGISNYTASPLPVASTPYPMIAPFFADVDTRATNGGNVWYRTTQSAAELAAIGTKVMSSVAGLTNFTPTFAQVVTWDRVGYYPERFDRVSTFQAVVATDGLQTYTLFLYPNRAIWWDRGSASPAGSFAQVGVTDGTVANTLTFAGTGTAAVRDLWFLSNTADNSPGSFVFDVSGSASDLSISGTHTLTAASPTVVPTLSLSANPAGHFITGTAATVDTVTNVNPSIQFNSLQFADATNRVTFQANAVALARSANAITHGNLTFADTSRLVAGATGALNGGTIILQKDAKLALYAAGATTSATTLVFDKSAGSTGGTLDLRGFNTTFGAISSVDAIPAAGLITNSGATAATLTTHFDAADLTFSGTLQDGSAALGLVKQGTGTLTLTGTNTYSGGTTLAAGALALGSANALGPTGTLTFAGGTLQFSAGNTTDYSARFSQAAGQAYRLDTKNQNITLASALSSSGGSITKLGSGTLTLSGNNSYTGTTALSEGTLQIGSGGTTGTLGSGAVINDGMVVFNRTNSISVSNSISGTGGIAQIGSGTLTLSGNNSFTGGAILSAGTLELGSAGALGSSGYLIFTGGTLRFSATNTTDYSSRFFYVNGQFFRLDTNGQNVSLASELQGSNNPLTKLGAGTLTLAGNNSYAGVTTISGGTLQVGNGGTSGSLGSGSVTNNASLIFNRSDSVTVTNAISGSGSLTKLGAGTLVLNAANSYSGGTTISAGTLQIGNDGTTGSLGGIIVNNATLTFHRSDASIHGGEISGTGQVVVTNPGSASYFIRLSGNNTYSGGTTVTTGSSLLLGHANALGSGLVTLQANSILFGSSYHVNLAQLASPDSASSAIVTTSGAYAYDSAASANLVVRLQGASSGFTKSGTGTLTLSGTNTYSGTTTISAGTLQIGSGDTTGTLGSSNVVNNATLLFNRSNTLSVAHEISGTGSVGTAGPGTLTLTGNNSYTGGTTLGAGTLALGSANAISTTGTISFNGGTLQFTSANTTDYSARFSNAANQAYRVDTNSQNVTLASALTSSGGTLTKLGGGTLTLTGTNTFSGTTTISTGTLQIGNGGTTGSLSGTITNNATLAFNRSNAYFHSGAISGSGAVTVTNGGGAGNFLLLSGNNTYSGGTTLTAGSSILLGHANGLGPGPVTLGANSILFGSSHSINLTQFTGPGSDASAIITTSGAYTYDSTSSGTVGVRVQGFTSGFNKLGSGTLTLTGANSYSGATTITGGTLQIGNGGTTGSLGFDSVTNHAALAFNRSNALTVGNTISGSGSLTQLGAGTLTLTAANTYSGGTTITAGTLKVANSSGSVLGSGNVTVASGATLTGSGSFTGSLHLAGTLAPGNSPGTLSAGHTTFAAGGTYLWEINHATGSAGTNYDLLSISGTLTLAATSGNPFTLQLVSLQPNDAAGNVINFNAAQNSAYTIATTTGGILGFDTFGYQINTSGFANSLAGGTWSLALTNSNRDLTLSFTAAAAAIPEPSTYAMLAGLGALALAFYRRRGAH